MHEYYYRNAIIKKLQADSHPVNRTENDMAYKIEHSKYDHIALRYQTTNPDAATLPINARPVKNLNLTEYMREEPNLSHSPIVTDVVNNYEVSTSPPERFPSIKAHEDWWDQMSIEWRDPQPIVIRDIAAGYQETHNENYKYTVDSTQLVTDVGFETCSKLWNPALRQDTAPWRQGDYMQALQTSVGHTSTPPMSPGLITVIESPEALNLALQWLDKTNADTFTQYQYVITPILIYARKAKVHLASCNKKCKFDHQQQHFINYGHNGMESGKVHLLALILADFMGHSIGIKPKAFGVVNTAGMNQYQMATKIRHWFSHPMRTFYTYQRSLLSHVMTSDFNFRWEQRNLADLRGLYALVNHRIEQAFQFMGNHSQVLEVTQLLGTI
ncbi:MAG: hypothetical protein GY740_05060, partial [Gammaproteobacteria bacterium]|nr:hypothetical protein [Gammaproteobacteria bacterium]